ncbi:MAG TPA: tRNA pseudouridine(38-40) synthase TruA [Lachnospiraceae bacterium]|nr:tRNA pseudouridine(38-40) synthase TruA [Lachnospiraceae bacterium]
MANYKMIIKYEGTRFNGWQKQGNTKNTIQEKIEAVLSEMTGEAIEISGSGRTDAGAHAYGQVANFRMKNEIAESNILSFVNKNLPQDIAVSSVERVNDRFHSRLNAKRKTYIYRIWNSEVSSVFDRRLMYTSTETMDIEEMKKAASQFLGSHDFKSFCSNKRYKKSTVREIYSIDVKKIGDEVRLTFCGNGFLYNMVRIMAGTIVQVGEGKIKSTQIPAMLEAKDRELSGVTLPAQGLTLLNVEY